MLQNASEKWQRQVRNSHIIKKQLENIFLNWSNNVKLYTLEVMFKNVVNFKTQNYK
ncbi:Uncharacterised protein [Mesomycoplasma dispar]|uniref:Uncharacterized protein n=1 Tax=Mesomycoplasma dispar TaxID=86660 RepID=A0AAJ5NRN5_9BACT|nr:Uncharacterised protein [Mesomycoplasma dispar]